MASNHTPRNIVPLHRGGNDQPRDYAEAPRFVRPRPLEHIARRGLMDRIAAWFGSERGFGFALGFFSGCMFTVAVALLLVVIA